MAMDNEKPAPAEPALPQVTPTRKYAFEDYAFQFITITGGVLIALLINGLVQWDSDRRLFSKRATIAQELADNMNEVRLVLGGNASRMANLDNALKLADELLATEPSGERSVNLAFNIADLSSAAWDSAARTGALSHMDYSDVQAYSAVYALQDLFAEQQAKTMEHLTAALALFSGGLDPAKARPDDIARFRERILLMNAGATVEEQLANSLIERYGKVLARSIPP
jgi:hypothetical protein